MSNTSRASSLVEGDRVRIAVETPDGPMTIGAVVQRTLWHPSLEPGQRMVTFCVPASALFRKIVVHRRLDEDAVIEMEVATI